MDKVPWNRVILEEFVSLALLSEEDENILRTRVDPKWSQVHQGLAFYVSSATVTRRVRKMREKYQSLVPYSDKLPENLDF